MGLRFLTKRPHNYIIMEVLGLLHRFLDSVFVSNCLGFLWFCDLKVNERKVLQLHNSCFDLKHFVTCKHSYKRTFQSSLRRRAYKITLVMHVTIKILKIKCYLNMQCGILVSASIIPFIAELDFLKKSLCSDF